MSGGTWKASALPRFKLSTPLLSRFASLVTRVQRRVRVGRLPFRCALESGPLPTPLASAHLVRKVRFRRSPASTTSSPAFLCAPSGFCAPRDVDVKGPTLLSHRPRWALAALCALGGGTGGHRKGTSHHAPEPTRHPPQESLLVCAEKARGVVHPYRLPPPRPRRAGRPFAQAAQGHNDPLPISMVPLGGGGGSGGQRERGAGPPERRRATPRAKFTCARSVVASHQRH